MMTVGVVTVGRSDYGIYQSLLKKIKADRELDLCLIAGGMHFSERYGATYQEIEAGGYTIDERVEVFQESDTPEDITKSMAAHTAAFAEIYAKRKIDILVVLGDRFEMHASALAALPFKIPVAHIHGGELTQGAIDDALRHSITKLSHLHFASTEEYARRIIQMGEEPWRVQTVGAPGLDHLKTIKLMKKKEIEDRLRLRLPEAPLLVTYHPVTLEYENAGRQADELLAALRTFRMPVIITLPNADTSNGIIRQKIKEFAAKNPRVRALDNLGTRAYFSVMALSAAMVGNSSSGIIEAPSFGLPVVNVGNRQEGRVRGKNVIDTGNSRKQITEGIRAALAAGFRKRLTGSPNPYFRDGRAAEIILKTIKKFSKNRNLILKKFNDSHVAENPESENCVILGGGGHARVVMDCLKTMNGITVCGILDNNTKLRHKKISGAPVLGNDNLLKSLSNKNVKYFVVGVGGMTDSDIRRKLYQKGVSAGLEPLSVIHSTAFLSAEAKAGPGCQFFAKSAVNPGSVLGKGVIVNTSAIVEHDCRLGDFSHAASGAKLGGGVHLGAGAFVGMGAVVKQGVSIGSGAVVGAGAVVVKNVAKNTVVAGVPARILKKK